VSVPAVGVLEGVDVDFVIDPHTRHCLINGLDDIGLTLEHEPDITAYEQRRPAYRPLVPTP
jgi:3-isopropylmalate dehydratase small subunit